MAVSRLTAPLVERLVMHAQQSFLGIVGVGHDAPQVVI
jgi:hypothetical protein